MRTIKLTKFIIFIFILIGLTSCGSSGGGSGGNNDNDKPQSTTPKVNTTPTTNTQSNKPPTANAGSNKSVKKGSNILFSGASSSDSDGNIVSYKWSKGSITLSNSVSFIKSNFSIGVHIITLTVTDDDGATGMDTMTVTISEEEQPNQDPTANAGNNQSVKKGYSVLFSGISSDDSDGYITSYKWSEGGTTLSNSVSFIKSNFSVGVHTITLTVTDDDGATGMDTMTVTISEEEQPNQDPTANAGINKSATQGSKILFSGASSNDSDGNIVSYKWSEGSITLSNSVDFNKSNFSVGVHAITLTVTDDDGATGMDTMTVTISEEEQPNQDPTANAGSNKSSQEGSSILFSGASSSDSDGNIVSYKWSEGSITLSSLVSFSKSNFSVGVHTIILTVTDDDGATDTDTMTVTISEKVETTTETNQNPTANAGSSRAINENDSISFNASNSTDSDGNIASYEWKEGGTILSNSMNFSKNNFSLGAHAITLKVTDNDGAEDSTTINIYVHSAVNTILIHGLSSGSSTWETMAPYIVKQQGKTGEYIEISFNIGIYRSANCDDANGINEKIPCTSLTDILSNPAYRGLFSNQSEDTIFGLDKGQFEVLKINWRKNTQSSSSGVNENSQKLGYKYNRVFAINFSNKNQLTFDAQGVQLKKAIDDIASITGVNKFNLIGHSMGGLAARAYIQNETTKDIESLITIDTPHLGGIGAGVYVAPTKNAAVNLHKDSLALKNLNENADGKYSGMKVWHLGYSDETKLKNGERFFNGSDGNVKIYSQMGLDTLNPHRVIFSPDTSYGTKIYGEAYTLKADLPLKYANQVFTSENYLETIIGGAHVKVLSDPTYIQYVLSILK